MEISTKAKKIISSILVTTTLVIPAKGFAETKEVTINVNNQMADKLKKSMFIAKTESQSNKEIKVYFNDEEITFDQQPLIVDGRTKVPFRAIFETMGTIVYYRASDSSILGLTRDGDVITHTVGTNKATINGVEKTYDSVSEIVNDRTLIPVRMVADLLSAEVNWKEKTQEVEIEKEIKTNDYNKKIRGIMGCVLDQNFNPEDFKRYLDYQYNNWDMDPKQVIINVNMDLDLELVEEQRWCNEKYHTYVVPKKEDIKVSYNTNDPLILLNRFNILPKDYKTDSSNWPELMLLPTKEYGDGQGFASLNPKACMAYEEMGKAAQEAGCRTGALRCIDNALGYRDDIPNFDWYLRKELENVTNDTYLLNSIWLEPYNCEAHTGFLVGIGCEISPRYTAIKHLILQGRFDLASQIDEFSEYYYKIPVMPGKTYPVHPEWLGYEDEFKVYNWLEQNCYKYGFIERFPKDKEYITRYAYMPWYYKYVGVDVAKIIKDNNWCFEEYYARYLNPTEYKTDLESTKKKVLSRY